MTQTENNLARRGERSTPRRYNKNAFLARLAIYAVLFFISLTALSSAQESPYIVTYDHYLEEPGNLEVEYFSTFGTQRTGNDFHSFWVEFEYGATAWWTTEFYLDGQTTLGDSTVFTGFRWENRFRPLDREHFVNPVLYIEYEQISEADKIIKEVEGHDIESDHADPNAILARITNHELEFKLLLSKTFKGWNVAVNPLATKNLSPSNPWEFGYAIGASRPLALKASPNRATSALRISSPASNCTEAWANRRVSACTRLLSISPRCRHGIFPRDGLCAFRRDSA